MSYFSKRENLDFYIALLIGFSALAFGVWFVIAHPKVSVIYDCSISEISPDFPVEVKEKCRQLRATRN